LKIPLTFPSGHYCETLGWLAMSGVPSSSYHGIKTPHGVPNPTRKAGNDSGITYARRYMDWNRLTFEYHAVGSQEDTFDYHSGLRVTEEITDTSRALDMKKLYGCAPATYCFSCKPFGDPGNIFSLVPTALSATVLNADRSKLPHIIIINTGSIRFDLVKGPFIFNDAFIVSLFNDAFQYIADVPYAVTSKVLDTLNNQLATKKRSSDSSKFGTMPLVSHDTCTDPTVGPINEVSDLMARGIKRQTQVVTPGYVTKDDFGTDGDDTPHTNIPSFTQPEYVAGNASLPATGSPTKVDLIFLDFIAPDALNVLRLLGATYTTTDVQYYLPNTGPNAFTLQNYLPAYAKLAWQAGVPNCPVS
jgi:hypothetical protein